MIKEPETEPETLDPIPVTQRELLSSIHSWCIQIVQNGFIVKPLLRPDLEFALIAHSPSELSDILAELQTLCTLDK